jgi:hypothetical protein
MMSVHASIGEGRSSLRALETTGTGKALRRRLRYTLPILTAPILHSTALFFGSTHSISHSRPACHDILTVDFPLHTHAIRTPYSANLRLVRRTTHATACRSTSATIPPPTRAVSSTVRCCCYTAQFGYQVVAPTIPPIQTLILLLLCVLILISQTQTEPHVYSR